MKDNSAAGALYGFDSRTNQQSAFGRNQSSKSIKPEATLRLSKNYPTESGVIDTNAIGATTSDGGNTLSTQRRDMRRTLNANERQIGLYQPPLNNQSGSTYNGGRQSKMSSGDCRTEF